MKSCLILKVLLASLLLAVSVQARINVDTVPARDSVQLTIYNSVDLTMVRETRYLTFRKGLNHLEFSWANTLIDPTSVEFKALTHAEDVEVLDVSFPPRVTNVLEWRINSEFSGEVKVEIRYFTSGISWAADYVAEASREEKLVNLAGFVKVKNLSGEDYENAQIRLVVGVIKLVEDIAKLARQEKVSGGEDKPIISVAGAAVAQHFFETGLAGAEGKPREIVKEGFSEYFLYTVEGRDTIPNGWSKRLPSFAAKEVPLASYYKFEKERWGDGVERFYRFKNDKKSKLGDEPLPNGEVVAFRLTGAEGLYSFVGNTAVKYIPIDENVDLDLGADQEVALKTTLMDWHKEDLQFDKDGNVAGWTVVEAWRIEAQDSKEIPVTLDIRRNFTGDWAVKTSAQFEKVDANKIKFMLELAPREKRTLNYEVVTRFGANATR